MRYDEVDALRGLAVIGMMIYHLLVDLEMFYGVNIGVFNYPVVMLARAVGVVFTTLLGMGSHFLFEKERTSRIFIPKALKLLGWAVVITGVTYILFPTQYVRFGILHLMGVSLLLLAPLVHIKSNLLLSLMGGLVIISSFLIKPPSFNTLDYYPPIPWLGFSIWGIVIGRIYAGWRKANIKIPRIKALAMIGRHSLLIYLVHQPILLAALYILFGGFRYI